MRRLLLVAGLLLAGCSKVDHDRTAGRPDLVCTASELKRTAVTSHLEFPLRDGTNVLWCATFQIAWNELCTLAGSDVHMQREDPMVALLNKKLVTRADLDERTYVAAAGFVGDGILETIPKLLGEKFGGRARPKLAPAPRSFPPGYAVAYAYLFANLPFEWAFKRFEQPMGFDGTDVECFGIHQYLKQQVDEERAASQVTVYGYQAPGDTDYVVELKTKLPEHRVLLARVPRRETLKATIEAVQKLVASAKSENLGEGATLWVPVLNFDLTRDYRELLDRALQARNPRLQGQALVIAKQQIRFRLDERGAVLKSEGVMVAKAAGQALFFNKPFLIMIQYRKAALPYFALWVDNAELLVPFKG